MKSNLKIKSMVFLFFLFSLFVFIIGVHAEEKMVTISEKDFIEYMNTVKKYDDSNIEALTESAETQNEIIKKLKEQIELHKINKDINLKVIKGYEKNVAILEKHVEYTNDLIKMQREDILRLETKGSKDRIGKVSRIIESTASGCVVTLAVAGLDLGAGCAIGFISGLFKDFVHGF